MHTLAIDIETYSQADLSKTGVYRYAQDPSFTVLLFAYKIDDAAVQIIDLASGERIPQYIIEALTDPLITKTAFNANFEMVCLGEYLSLDIDASQWDCTMVRGAMLGLPFSLDRMGAVLRIQQQKDFKGKALIRYFCIPCKPTKINDNRTRNLPIHDVEKWKEFKAYCIRDVEAEQEIRNKLLFFQPTEFERRVWAMDFRINKRGIAVDMQLVNNAIEMLNTHSSRLFKEAQELTGLDNPNSITQLRKWVNDNLPEESQVENLAKATVTKLILEMGQWENEQNNVYEESDPYDPLHDQITDTVKRISNKTVARVLQIRQELSKTSTKKYSVIANSVCRDGRVKGLVQYYGANRTGRWCLAEDTKVLVKTAEFDIKEKPIQDVLLSDLVFDGENWVEHEGVVFSGDKEVIEWDGIVATAEHIVYISSEEKMPLAEALDKKIPLWKGNIEYTK